MFHRVPIGFGGLGVLLKGLLKVLWRLWGTMGFWGFGFNQGFLYRFFGGSIGLRVWVYKRGGRKV